MPAILTDFGLAKVTATGSKYTRTGQALGTPAYMSPEQARGEVGALSPATDVWGLGVVLYELLAGHPPFEGGSAAEVVAHLLVADPPPLRRIRPDLPPGVALVVRVALTKAATRRHADAGQLRDDLDRVLRNVPPRVRPARPWRWPALVGGVAVVAAVAAGVAVAGRRGAAVAPPAVLDDPAEDLARRARAMRHSEPATAERLLGEALASRPSRHDWRTERGLLRWAVADAAGARAEWALVPPDAPEAPVVALYTVLESLHWRRGQSHAARTIEAAFATTARGDARTAALGRAARALWDRRPDEAARGLIGLDGWEAALLRAGVATRAGREDDAAEERDWSAALDAGIPFWWAHHNRACSRHALGDYRGALADFDAALAVERRTAGVWAGRAASRWAVGDREGAEQDIGEALALDPADSTAHITRGRIRAAGGDADGALAALDAAVAGDPDWVAPRYERATLRLDRGDAAGARDDLDLVVARNPALASGWSARGIARHALGDLQGALADHGEALRRQPTNDAALADRGTVYLELGDLVRAEADLLAAVAVDPESVAAWANLSVVRVRGEDWAGAAVAARAALRLVGPADPRHAGLAAALADCEAHLPREAR